MEYIAHIREDNATQTVCEHCESVAEYAASEGERIGLGKTLYLAGLLHDMGKNTATFQEYIKRAHEDPTAAVRGEVNHSSAGGIFISEFGKGGKNFRRLTAQLIAYAITAHHGVYDCLDFDGRSRYQERLQLKTDIFYDEALKNSDYIDKKKIDALFAEACGEVERIVLKACDIAKKAEGGANYNITTHFMLGALQRIVLSILIDSDRRDTAEFMSGDMQQRYDESQCRDLWKEYADRLAEYIGRFTNDTHIAKLRAEMSQHCFDFAAQDNGIYKLSAPTGGGKTLASMRYALEFAKRTGKRHIYYVAPFVSILEQNAVELKKIFRDDENILEHHSNVVFDDSDDTAAESLRRYELFSEDWSSPVIFTTMVQLLNSLFSGKSRCIRRVHQLKDSVIIIDEAQSLPVKCIHMFNSMCNFLSYCCNSSIILCTATQPLFEKVDRKILYGKPSDIIPEADKYAEEFKRVDIIDAVQSRAWSTDELTDFILDKFNRNMLVILNTKAAVKKLTEALGAAVQASGNSDIKLVELTTYMCAAHRIDVINALKKNLSSERILCVSTQLVEAGVDISFECVVRSLAGLDSVAQAAGRCNRNGEVKLGKMYVVDYNEENTVLLKDIHKAKEAMRSVMSAFDGDYLRPRAMELYYKQYFFDRRYDMDYEDSLHGYDLYSMLSFNKRCRSDYRLKYGKDYTDYLAQTFRTAGNIFSVIDDGDMAALIVPYGKGLEYIEELKICRDITAYRNCLRKLQRYTVNVFRNDRLFKALLDRHAIDASVLDGRVLIVDKDYYKDNGLDDRLGMLSM